MVGLTRTDAATASLFLTLEGAATALMAWFIFHKTLTGALRLAWPARAGAALSWSGKPTVDSIIAQCNRQCVSLGDWQ
jgi:drug/metabolite transporter (DMT)-like permease